jgi:hypothetical protein
VSGAAGKLRTWILQGICPDCAAQPDALRNCTELEYSIIQLKKRKNGLIWVLPIQYHGFRHRLGKMPSCVKSMGAPQGNRTLQNLLQCHIQFHRISFVPTSKGTGTVRVCSTVACMGEMFCCVKSMGGSSRQPHTVEVASDHIQFHRISFVPTSTGTGMGRVWIIGEIDNVLQEYEGLLER